jgi:UDP-GlcNAc:undecaprenyl-phosphate GlcNAc-1-phosphate transferase
MNSLPYIAVFVASFGVALCLTPVVIRLARKWRLYDPKDARKVHQQPVPRIGGLAIVVSMMIVSVAAVLVDPYWGQAFAGLHRNLIILFAASGFVFLVGVVDDIKDVRAVVKLLAQIAAATFVCSCGIRIGDIVLFGWSFGWLSWPITILWIVGITNAVNLIDGLDGLSAGICAAACAVIAGFAIFTGQAAMGILMLTLLGSLVGFLVFNFNPAKIFMGDSGSMFLGFFLATASIVCATKVATIMGLILPALALGLPIFDMLLAVVRRLLDRRSLFSPDRAHVHHRLLEKGIKHHHVVILMYIVTLLATGAGLLMMVWRDTGGIEVIIFLAALLVLMSVFRLAGTLRFRKMWSQMKTNVARSREVRRERKHFESMQNRFRMAWTFDQWWRAVRRMARRMSFARLVIHYRKENSSQVETLTYARKGNGDGTEAMHLSIPVRKQPDGKLLKVEIDVDVDEPLETIGRRLSLFGRLLDEHALADLPGENDKNQTEERK